MRPDRQRVLLEELAADGRLTPQGLEQGLLRLGFIPDAAAWYRFADRLMLAAGCLLILAGVIFFFAYNWQQLHRFARIGLVASALTACVLMAWRGRAEGPVGQAWLGAASFLVGALLAVTGQIYQTGADSELLFAAWALLILPWVLVGCLPWLWLFWLLVVNAGLLLFIAGRLDVWAFLMLADSLFWAPLALNGLALLVWEVGWTRRSWLRAAYAPRLLALAAGISASAVGVSWWWLSRDAGWRWLHYTPLLYAFWLAAVLWYYQTRRCDIVPLSIAAMSVIVVLTAGMLRHLRFREAFAFDFLLLGVVIAGLSAAAAVWLRRLSANWERGS